MIRSFADARTEAAFHGRHHRSVPPDIRQRARRKLRMIHASATLDDLASPPSNRLEALRGDRVGQYSIRINRQWRICFRWDEGDAYEVEVVDYHS